MVNTTLLSNEVRRALGTHATDQQTKLMDATVGVGDLENKTPDQIKALREQLGQILNTVGSVIGKSQSQIESSLGHDANTNLSQSNNTSPFKTVSMQSINEYAQKYNLPVSTVIQRLKNKGAK